MHRPRGSTTRARRHAFARALAHACAALAVAATTATAASSSTVVTMQVPSATTLDATACAPSTPGVTEFGVVQPDTAAVTSADCQLAWGSSNDSSMLRAFQSDGVGSAMGEPSGTWVPRTTIDSARFEDLAAGSASTAYAIRPGSSMRLTTDGGGSWQATAPTGDPLRGVGVAAGSPNVAVVVGDNGGIARTTTSGSSWTVETSGTTVRLQDVSMSDDTNGFAVGHSGTILRRTTAGGTTWAPATSVGTNIITSVAAVSPSVVFVAGYGSVLRRSEDGGVTWDAPASTCDSTWHDIVAMDADTAFAVGLGGTVVRIDWNSGTSTLTCTRISSQRIGEDLLAVSVRGTDVFVAGALGTLLRTSDMGATWTHLKPGTAVDFFGLATPPDGSTWVAGTSDTVARNASGDDDLAIVRVEGADTTTLTDVAAFSDRGAFVVGGQVDRGGLWEAAIRRTDDGGATWTSQESGTGFALFGVDTVDDGQVAVAVGDYGQILYTHDAGDTWSFASTPGTNARLFDVDMVDAYHGWAVGNDGTIRHTTNGGSTWQAQASPTTQGLRGVSAVDRQLAFAVGTRGRILRTVDGGATWVSLGGVPTSTPLDDVVAVDADTVLVGFSYRWLMRSVDASAPTPTWTLHGTGTGGDIFAIDAVSADAIFMGMAWGTFVRSLDGAASWDNDGASGAIHIYGLDALDENAAWAVGPQNVVLRMDMDPATAFGDYDDAGPNWSSGASMFGACLRDATGATVTPDWTVDASCTPSGTGVWRGIPATSGDADAKVAGASGATTAAASLRFGMFVAPDQPPGRYSAGISFEVVAPEA